VSPPVRLDLVICTYNHAPRLGETLQALAAQQVSEAVRWRVLIVDNNCSDDTPDVIAREAPSIAAPVETVREARQGLNAARLRGVRSGDGDWIAFVDDDCVLAPDWVEQAGRFALAHPDCGAFGGEVRLRWTAPPPAWVEGYGYAFAETQLGDAPQRRDWLAGAGMVLRRDALVATGWTEHQFLEDRIGRRLVSGGDVELGLRIAARHEIWYVPQCRLQHVIPASRTERRYLRRLVFGLGVSNHDVEALIWTGSERDWWRDARARALGHARQGARRIAHDLRRRRPALDVALAFAFAAGWCAGMVRLWRLGRVERRERLGSLARAA